jgi:hypothetical protein
MKNKIKIFAACAIALSSFMVSCTKDFTEINTDPNRIDQISPGTLLNPLIYDVATFNMDRADNITFELMQVKITYPDPSGGIHRYEITEGTGSSTWSNYYRAAKNVKEMYEASVKAQDPNYQAIAMTLNAWIYSNLTDVFGDVPFSEASRGDDNKLYPKFDEQRVIYTQILKDLDSANKLYTTSRTMVYGTDILFANNVTKWKKFTNSLAMRLLLRLSKKSEIESYTKLKAMISNPTVYPVFNNNTEHAVLNLTGITPLVSPWGRPQDFTTFRAAGEFFLDSLNAMNDPRRAKFATDAKANNGSSLGYKGIPAGYDPSQNFNFTPSNLSQALAVAPMIVPILPYSEVEFIKAETEFKVGTAAAAKTAYEKGVKAAIEQWGAVMPADYFTNTNTTYNGSLERIMLQKYYALFFVDFQQWFEYRRTGLPVLPKNAGMLNNKVMPSRLLYPIAVKTNNNANYQEAASRMGGDDINTKVWWEKP